MADPREGSAASLLADGLALPPKRRLLTPAVCAILAVEFCERFTYYTLNGSQRNFLMDAGFTQSQATSMTLAFTTAVYPLHV